MATLVSVTFTGVAPADVEALAICLDLMNDNLDTAEVPDDVVQQAIWRVLDGIYGVYQYEADDSTTEFWMAQWSDMETWRALARTMRKHADTLDAALDHHRRVYPLRFEVS